MWTSKTTFAYQGIGGTNNEANQEMFFVPPLNCKAPRRIDNIPLIQSSGSGDVTFIGGITIVAETGASIQINGVPTTASPQSVLGNFNYETYLISGLTGDIKRFIRWSNICILLRSKWRSCFRGFLFWIYI